MATAKAKVDIAGKDRKTSRHVKEQLPNHIVDSESLLVRFMEAYYEWMEKEGAPTGDTKRLLEYMSIDATPDKFIDYFRREFLPGIPKDIVADKRLLLKHARDFYRARGTERAYKLLFRLLYNEDVEVIYPKNDILRASDGIWVKEMIIRVNSKDTNISELESRKIYGKDSGANAIVESIRSFFSGNEKITELSLTSLVGVFDRDEIVETRDDPALGLPKIEARVYGITGSYKIDAGGSGYSEGVSIPISNMGDGRDFAANIASVDGNGAITSIEITNPGVGYYNTAPTADLSSLGGSGGSITFNVTGQYISNGTYDTNQGKISSTPVIQDGQQYQEYSYLLRSGVPIDSWLDIVLSSIHPAGMYIGGQFEEFTAPSDLTNQYMMFHTTQPEAVNYNNPDYASSRFFFEPQIIVRKLIGRDDANPEKDVVVREKRVEIKRDFETFVGMLRGDEIQPYILNFSSTQAKDFDGTSLDSIEWKRDSYPQTFHSAIWRTATYVDDYWEEAYTNNLIYVD